LAGEAAEERGSHIALRVADIHFGLLLLPLPAK
jgi:hypothetical protein